MALPTCYFLDADNADDTDLLSFYPYHPRYLFLKGILLKVLMRFPVLFLNFERHFLILSEYARFKSCNQLSVLVCYIYLIATCTSSTITFLRASGPGDTLFAEARERYIGRERES